MSRAGRTQEGGWYVAPPQTRQNWHQQLDIGQSGGFDSVRLKLPWGDLPPILSAMFLCVNDDGVVGENHQYRFGKLRSTEEDAPSFLGGWGFKPETEADGTLSLVLEGSPAKAATGQNLYLPEAEGLFQAVWLGLRPFLWTLGRRLSRPVEPAFFQKLMFRALGRASVQRLDLTSHLRCRGRESAIALIGHCDRARGGLFVRSGSSVRRWGRQSDTSLACGPGRRWGAVLYSKQCEMAVPGHCPRLRDIPGLFEEAEGIVRYEYRHRSELMTEAERDINYWTGERLREQRLKDFSKVYWPGLPAGSIPRHYRRRVGHDLVVARVAARLNELARALGKSSFGELPDELAKTIQSDFSDIYAQKKVLYSLEDVVVENMEPEEMEDDLRKKDRQYLMMWHAGVDVYATIRERKRTASRVVNNILKATGIDIRAPKEGEGIQFEKAISVSAWQPSRNWQELLAA